MGYRLRPSMDVSTGWRRRPWSGRARSQPIRHRLRPTHCCCALVPCFSYLRTIDLFRRVSNDFRLQLSIDNWAATGHRGMAPVVGRSGCAVGCAGESLAAPGPRRTRARHHRLCPYFNYFAARCENRPFSKGFRRQLSVDNCGILSSRGGQTVCVNPAASADSL